LEALLKLKQERIEALELQTNRSQTAVGTSIETVEVEAERTESGGRRGLLRRLFG
jgi:hypothetical protein